MYETLTEIAPGVTIIKRRKPIKVDKRTTREHKRLKHSCVSEGCMNTVRFCYEIGKPVSCNKHIELCKELNNGREPFDTYRDYCIQCLEQYYKDKPIEKPTRATYGKKDDKKPTFCDKHAKEAEDPDLVDIVSVKCIGKSSTEPCTNGKGGHPASATIGEKGKPQWCAKCKPTDKKVVNAFRSCACGQTASYGKAGKKATHCAKCKDKEKLEVVDVTHKKCACGVQAVYGIEGTKNPTHCAKCAEKVKDILLVDIKNKQCKHTSKCRTQPSYGYPGGQAEMCKIHAKEYPDMIDLHHKMCETCGTGRINEKFGENICGHCYFIANPDAPLTKNFKIKELFIRKVLQELLETKHPDVNILAMDKTVPGGCSKRRPDFAIDCGTHIVIVECDENQHSNIKYETSCENKRMMELFMDCGSLPIRFIRFNPDPYFDSTGKKQRGCFSVSKDTRKLVLEKTSNWLTRKTTLCHIVSKAIETIPDKEVSITHLFYDGPQIQGDLV